MTDLMQIVAAFLQHEFHNELALVASLSSLGQVIYGFYALAAVLVIRPHIRQAMKYRHGEAGKGDFCHRAQYEAIFWRLAPLLYAFVIDSKLLALSVFIDIVGRIWTIHESHRAEKRFIAVNRAMQLAQPDASVCSVDSSEPEAPTTDLPSALAHRETTAPCPLCVRIPLAVSSLSSRIYNRSGAQELWRKYDLSQSLLSEFC